MTEQEILRELAVRRLPGTVLGAIAPELVCVEKDGCVLKFPVADWMANPHGTVHGGLAATMLDTAMGITAAAMSGNLPATVSMTVNYVRPVRLHTPLTVTVRAQHCGHTVAYLTAEGAQGGQVCVTATGAFYVASTCSAEMAETS